MLTKLDDYPVHQTSEPIAHPATSDRNFYDRYWFNGFDREGAFYFGVAMGLYPNRGVLDASFSIARDGEQHSFHVSRSAPLERIEMVAGPLAIEVVEPMKVVCVRLARNNTGIECDLTFRARTAAIEEPRSVLRRDRRVIMDTSRFTQFGRWEGTITAAGKSLAVFPERVYGVRDRSWGVRPVGEPEMGKPAMGQIFFLWSPLHFDDFCTHFAVFEDEKGEVWHSMGMRVPAYASPEQVPGVEDLACESMRSLGRQLEFVPGTRRIRRATITMSTRNGEKLTIELEPLLRFQMLGLGYLHPEWGHGCWKGELAIGAESWTLDDVDPADVRFQHIQQVCRGRLGEKTGVGVLEQLVLGPHTPSGFHSILDPAG